MAKKTNSWKLGLFVVLGIATGIIVLVGVGAARFDKPAVDFVTYFNESVQGLEVGAKIKFRGVPIGEVTHITIAPDQRHVEVHGKVYVDRLEDLGLRKRDEPIPEPDGQFVPPDLRIQLVQASLATGQKFLQSEFFDVGLHPRPPLSFPTPPNYIPSVASTTKSLEELVDLVAREFPLVLEQVKRLLSGLETSLSQIDAGAISSRTIGALDEADAVLKKAQESFDSLDAKLAAIDAAKLSQSGQEALDELNTTLAGARRIVARLERQGGMLDDLEGTANEARGTIATVQSTSLAVTDLARDGRDLEHELEEAVVAVKRAADSIRRLADTIEREPDMLLKGRSKRDNE